MGLLDQVIGGALGSRMGSGGRSSPLMMALMALLASRAMGGSSGGMMGGGGGLGGLLGGALGGGMGGGGLGGALGGGMGGGMGGPLGGLLGGGLGGLLQQFSNRGYGDHVQSWMSHGPNAPIAPHELEDALGPDTVEQLQQQTGMDRQSLLSELSDVMPGVVDQLTPHGRMPTDDELKHW